MKHVLSTHILVNHRLTTARLEKIWSTGIPAVEIFCARQHMDYRDKAQIRELAHWFRDSELQVFSLHSPMYTDEVWGRTGPHSVINLTETVKAKRIASVDEIKRAIEIAEHFPFRYLVQHIGVGGEEYDEHKSDAAHNSLEELGSFARHRGVEILVENIPNGFSTAERLVYFLAQTHLPVGFCFDVGHAHLEEGVAPAFERMADRIRSTHVHDNDGKSDSHLVPLSGAGGTVEWKNTMQLLRSRPDQFPLLLELKETPEMAQPIEEAARAFHALEEL